MINKKVIKRVGSLIKLKPEFEERYTILHKNTFPGVLDRIGASNIRNYSIFLLNGILFSYYEYIGIDYESDMVAIADETSKDWWKLTNPMQEPLPSRKEGEWWAEMVLIEHLNEPLKQPSSVKRFGYSAKINPVFECDLIDLFKEFDKTLSSFFKTAYIQNYNVFLKDEMIYLYFEYSGEDFIKDNEKLQANEKVIEWNTELKQYLCSPWNKMVEVFHTN